MSGIPDHNRSNSDAMIGWFYSVNTIWCIMGMLLTCPIGSRLIICKFKTLLMLYTCMYIILSKRSNVKLSEQVFILIFQLNFFIPILSLSTSQHPYRPLWLSNEKWDGCWIQIPYKGRKNLYYKLLQIL